MGYSPDTAHNFQVSVILVFNLHAALQRRSLKICLQRSSQNMWEWVDIMQWMNGSILSLQRSSHTSIHYLSIAVNENGKEWVHNVQLAFNTAILLSQYTNTQSQFTTNQIVFNAILNSFYSLLMAFNAVWLLIRRLWVLVPPGVPTSGSAIIQISTWNL